MVTLVRNVKKVDEREEKESTRLFEIAYCLEDLYPLFAHFWYPNSRVLRNSVIWGNQTQGYLMLSMHASCLNYPVPLYLLCFWVTPNNTKSLFLDLYSRITPVRSQWAIYGAGDQKQVIRRKMPYLLLYYFSCPLRVFFFFMSVLSFPTHLFPSQAICNSGNQTQVGSM